MNKTQKNPANSCFIGGISSLHQRCGKVFHFFTILMFGLLTACSSDSDPSSPPYKSSGGIAKMDIGDASALFVAQGGDNGGRANTRVDSRNDESVLFKITRDGVVKQVTYKDSLNNEITDNIQPSGLYILEDSPYFFVMFPEGAYMVNKSNGAVYKAFALSDIIERAISYDDRKPSSYNYFVNEKPLLMDSHNNMYYSNSWLVEKVDVADINNVTLESITPEADCVDRFVVSGNGELFYEYKGRDGNGGVRMRNAKGRFFRFDVTDSSLAFRGLDGNLHIFDRNGLRIIKFSGNSYDEVPVDLAFDPRNTTYNLGCGSWWTTPYCITLPDRILAIGREGQAIVLDSKNPADVTGELVNVVDGETIEYGIFNGITITNLQYGNSCVYCCGYQGNNYSLLRINPYTLRSETVISDDDYEIYSFVVQNDDTIIFNGLRISDGKTILASIDKTGRVTMLKETSSFQKIILERLQ